MKASKKKKAEILTNSWTPSVGYSENLKSLGTSDTKGVHSPSQAPLHRPPLGAYKKEGGRQKSSVRSSWCISTKPELSLISRKSLQPGRDRKPQDTGKDLLLL